MLFCLSHYCCVTNNSKLSGLKPSTFDDDQRVWGSGTWTGHSRDGLSLLPAWNFSWGDSRVGAYALTCLEALSLTLLGWGTKTHTSHSVLAIQPLHVAWLPHSMAATGQSISRGLLAQAYKQTGGHSQPLYSPASDVTQCHLY